MGHITVRQGTGISDQQDEKHSQEIYINLEKCGSGSDSRLPSVDAEKRHFQDFFVHEVIATLGQSCQRQELPMASLISPDGWSGCTVISPPKRLPPKHHKKTTLEREKYPLALGILKRSWERRMRQKNRNSVMIILSVSS